MSDHHFSYTEREWGFLQLVADWSGYFVPRQFDTYGGGSPGAITHALVRKLLTHRHATVTTHARNAHLYHLSSRPLYQALRQEDNRHRRKRPAYQVRIKLMALDFVLARRELQFLSSERQKVDSCLGLGISPEVLPQRSYRAKSGAQTTRYFLDKFPLFLCEGRVGFSFISGDAPSRAPFLTYLDELWPLFSALPSVPLVFVTSRPESTAIAEADLRNYSEKHRTDGRTAFLQFFSLRKQHENRDGELSITELRTLRDGLKKYSTNHHEKLYEAWSCGKTVASNELEIQFDVAVLPYSYDLFGDL